MANRTDNLFDEADRTFIEASLECIRTSLIYKRMDCPPFLNMDAFFDFYKDLLNEFPASYSNDTQETKKESIHNALEYFRKLSLDNFEVPSFFDAKQSFSKAWAKKYPNRPADIFHTNPAPNENAPPSPPPPAMPRYLLLGIEKNRLPASYLTSLAGGGLKITSADLQDFYKLPWFWHYGDGDLKDIQATLETELAASGDGADSIIIGTSISPARDLDISPETRGSEMRSAFEKLSGQTFRPLREFKLADLGKSSVKFYRMP